ncbi:MAG TPA: hypothetical protein VFS83_12505 [Ktedonobacterales bacterium]|nr:hypothetical protein [Ktedonobacterales bacterium]
MGTTSREGIPARASRTTRPSGAGIVVFAALLLLVLGLAGCALNGGLAEPTPAATTDTSGTPGAHATLTLPTLTAAASPSGPGGAGGVSEFCSKAPNVSIHPGSNILVYQYATLQFSQSNGSNAFFGYCTSHSTSEVQDFYATHLRDKGWSGLKTATIAAVVQITATQCASQNPPQIIVTIAPDATGTTTTSISIVLLAGTC